MFLLYNLVMEVIFQLTPSRRATSSVMNTCSHFGISTHALTEGDGNIYCYIVFGLFQLTPSRRATVSPCSFTPSGIFQLTPSRRATEQRLFFFCSFEISTHALTEGDNSAQLIFCGCCPFQLTPSRRATQLTTSYTAAMLISTHALTEGDRAEKG